MRTFRQVALTALMAPAALLVVAGCAGPAPDGAGPDGSRGPGQEAPGWRQVPGSLLSGRVGALVVGLDHTAYVVGGWELLCPPTADCAVPRGTRQRDGAAVDLRSGRWRRIADAPVRLGYDEAIAVDGRLYVAHAMRLLRYDPGSDEWTSLGRTPVAAGQLLEADGRIVVVTGSEEGGERPDQVYDPATGRWSALPDDPLPRTYDRFGVVDGDRLLLFGSPMVGPDEESAPKVAAAWSFRSRSWSRLPDAPGAGYQVWSDGARAWLNPHFFGPQEADAGGGVLDLATGRWSAFPEAPDDASWAGDMAGVIGAGLATYEYADGWVLDARAAAPQWVEVPAAAPGLEEQSVTAVGERLVAFGGARWDEGYRDGRLLDELWVWTPPA